MAEYNACDSCKVAMEYPDFIGIHVRQGGLYTFCDACFQGMLESCVRDRMMGGCCGVACESERDEYSEAKQIAALSSLTGKPIYELTKERYEAVENDPTFTVPLDLLESKSFDAIRID